MSHRDAETLERIAEAIRRRAELPPRPLRLDAVAARAAARRAEVLEARRQFPWVLVLAFSGMAVSSLAIPRIVAILSVAGARLGMPGFSLLVIAVATACVGCAALVFGLVPLCRRPRTAAVAKENE